MDALCLNRYVRFALVHGEPNAVTVSLSEEDVPEEAVVSSGIRRIARLWELGFIDSLCQIYGGGAAVAAARFLLRAFFATLSLGPALFDAELRLHTKRKDRRRACSTRTLVAPEPPAVQVTGARQTAGAADTAVMINCTGPMTHEPSGDVASDTENDPRAPVPSIVRLTSPSPAGE